MSAPGPGCVKTLPSNFRIEAQSQSCQSESKYCWQPQPRDDDRENHSVRPPLSRVFTQPGSNATSGLPLDRTRSPLWLENRPDSNAESGGTCFSPSVIEPRSIA